MHTSSEVAEQWAAPGVWEGRSTLSEVAYDLINRVLAVALVLLLSPVLLAIAGLVWRTDGSPVTFGHYRVGRNGKLFRCLKFRTMARNARELLDELLANDPKAYAEWHRDFKLTYDPRITKVGAFLRRTSLDELPQLFNVIRGDMALVGPRPITFDELRRYGRSRWSYLSVKPGMTGLWQVSGRSNVSYAERVALDARYVSERTWWLDLCILAKTARVVVFGDGAR